MTKPKGRSNAIKQDARAWADFTGSNYTSALRQMERPIARGVLGRRLSARRLIDVLETHPIIGADGGDFILGENGFYAEEPFVLNGKDDYLELAMIAEVLQMLTPSTPVEPDESSYALKHTAEWFLSPHHPYISNGRLIWAAAALGLPLAEEEGGSPNLLVGVSERGHDYVRRMIGRGNGAPQAHHHRPAGFEFLQSALSRYDSEEPFDRWSPEPLATSNSPFHAWFSLQAERQDPVGATAHDYLAGFRNGDHGIVNSGQELIRLLFDLGASIRFVEGAELAAAEWEKLQEN